MAACALAFREGEGKVAVFAHIRGNAPEKTRVDWQLPPLSTASGGTDRRLAVMEQLYAFALRQPPLTVFDLGHGDAATRVGKRQTLSQPQLLRRLAQWRQCAVQEMPESTSVRPTPWIVPSIVHFVASGPDARQVAARVRLASGGPYKGTLAFGRGEHLACDAPVQSDGSASCTLYDTHGDDDEHDPSSPTFMSYGGMVTPDRIVLPTTEIVTPRAKTSHPRGARKS